MATVEERLAKVERDLEAIKRDKLPIHDERRSDRNPFHAKSNHWYPTRSREASTCSRRKCAGILV